MIVHRKRVGNEADGKVIVESPEPFRAQAVDEKVESEIKNVGARRIRQGRTQKSAEGLCYRRVFSGDKDVSFLVLKELKLTVKEVVRLGAVSDKVIGYDRAQQKRAAAPERSVDISEGQTAAPKTARRKNKSWKKEERGTASESSGGTSSPEMSTPRVDIG